MSRKPMIMPTNEEIVGILQQEEFCLKLEEVARISASGRESNMFILRSFGNHEISYGEVFRCREDFTSDISIPEGYYGVSFLHSHLGCRERVCPSMWDLTPSFYIPTHQAVAGRIGENRLGIVVYLPKKDLFSEELAKERMKCVDLIEEGLFGSRRFQSQEEILEALRTYYPFATFLEYGKENGVYVPCN